MLLLGYTVQYALKGSLVHIASISYIGLPTESTVCTLRAPSSTSISHCLYYYDVPHIEHQRRLDALSTLSRYAIC